jgi:hypothetical protein
MNARRIFVTLVTAVLAGSGLWWVYRGPDVAAASGGVGAVSGGAGLALLVLVVFGLLGGALLHLASNRGVVPASVVWAQAALSTLLTAYLFVATGWTQERIESAATRSSGARTESEFAAEAERLDREYTDAIDAEWAVSARVMAAQFVVFAGALSAAFWPSSRRLRRGSPRNGGYGGGA